MKFKKAVIVLPLFVLIAATAHAQMERQRATTVEIVDDAFWAPTLITQTTTEQLAAKNLNVTIMHSFGIATTNVFQNFFGLDNVLNVRLGLDYGLTERWSAGIGRSSLFNVVDFRSKYAVLRQTSDDKMPVSLSLKGDLGIVTQENRQPIEDDISTLVSAIISRKFSDKFSLQLTPMYGHFNQVTPGNVNDLFSIGIGSEIHLSNRISVITEYYPVLGDRNPGTHNAFSLGLDIETGGHVFQLFFTSTEWHLEQFVLANNRHQFWAGDFRFGFNVNRIFGL